MIIGITGPLCAGTDTMGEILSKEFGFIWMSYSDVLREIAREKGIELTRKNLQDLGNEMREKEGNGFLSKALIENMEEGKDYAIGNIRNPGEVEVMREKFGDNFILVKIDAPAKERFRRLLGRRREKDPTTWQDFLKVESRDFGKDEGSSGQQHSAVFEMADFVVSNSSSFPNLRDAVRKLVLKLQKNS